MLSVRRLMATLLATAIANTVLILGSAVLVAAQTTGIPNSGNVVFSDDFTGAAGASFNTNNWEDFSTATYNSSAAFGNIAPGNNETLDGSGHLVIPATSSAGSGIRTGAKFGAKYGVFSAWMKVPSASGYWPAFWTLNNNPNGADTFPLGENDIMEAYTFDKRVYHGTGHTWTGSSSTDVGGPDNYCPGNWQTAGLDLSTAYHKYSAKVEPGVITYYFDDQQCGTSYLKEPGKAWGFGPDVTRNNWLILDLAVGGAGGQNTPVAASAQLLIDKVEVRALENSSPFILENGATYEIANECANKLVQPNPDVNGPNQLQIWPDQNMTIQRWKATNLGTGYWKFVNVSANKAMDVSWASQDNGAAVWLWDDNGTLAQQWQLKDTGNSAFELINHNSGKALDLPYSVSTDGSGLQQWVLSGNCGQHYKFTKV